MSIFDRLSSGRAMAKVRVGRHGPTQIDWQEPVVTALYLQHDHRGRCCLIALVDLDFAEFDPRFCMEGPALLCAEDYALEVFELPLGTSVTV